MNFCSNCILPDSRPNLIIQANGICNACNNHLSKNNIDWKNRKKEFLKITQNTIRLKRDYDCIIPISGGKDSTWQIIMALKYNLKPLCVTWKSPARNDIGNINLENAKKLGIDHLDVTINPFIEKYFTKKSFKKFGTTLIPMHMAIHSIPQQIALKFNIPLIIQGENSAFEYGGDKKNSLSKIINKYYLKMHGNTNGTIAEDWFDKKLNSKNMFFYTYPKDKLLLKKNIKTIFLGNYFEWDPVKTYNISKKYGFKNDKKPQTGIYNFADIDDSFLISVHHWLKWYKFGITRAWDNLSIEIRNNRMSRKKAIEIVNKIGEEKPLKQIKKFINYTEINENNFYKLCDQFRNKTIWKMNKNGSWIIKKKLK